MRRKATYWDRYLLEKDCNRRCARQGVRLRIDAKATTAYCTINPPQVVIPDFVGVGTPEELDLVRSYVVHECGHLARPEAFTVLIDAKIKMDDPLGFLFNIAEDEQMERITQAKWKGDRSTLERGRELHVKRMSAQYKAGEVPNTPDTNKSGAAYGMALCSRLDWDRNIRGSMKQFLRTTHPDTAKLLHELIDEGWDKRLASYMTAEQTLAYSRELKDRLWPPEQQQQQQDEPGEGTGAQTGDESPPGEGGAPEKAAKGNDPAKGENPSDKGDNASAADSTGADKGKGGDDGKEKGEGAPDTVPWQVFITSTATDEGGRPMAGHEVTVDWTGFDADKLTNEAVAPYPRECITMKDWKVLAKEGSPHHVDGYAARRAKDPESGFQLWHDDTRGHRALANNIRRYLMTLKRSKWQKERTTGRKINKRGLSRLATGSSDYNKRIFQRRIDHDDMDTAIMLLVDWSGSMHGLRSMLANLAAQRVNAVFGDALNLPLKIMTHTTRAVSGSDSMLNMELGTIKDWKDPRPSSREIADRFIRAAQEGMNTNADGDALMYARAELMKRPERRKILIILSDGQPSAHYLHRSKGTASAPGGRTASGFTLDNLSLKRYRSAALLKQVVKELAADTDVDFYAIGIGRTVKLGGFYGKENTQSIADLDCLNDVLLKTMRDCMLTAMKVD